MNPLDILKDEYALPVNSYVAAIQTLNHREPTPLPTEVYEKRIESLTGKKGIQISDKYARTIFLYLVQETIRVSYNSDVFDMNTLFSLSVNRAVKFVDQHPYLYEKKEKDEQPKLNAHGKPKRKKGAKKEEACRIYRENKDKSKKEIMELFMKQLDMSKAGASTYYYNCKKECI